MRTIEGLEIDYLRDQLRKAKANEELLVEEIYEWIMSNEGMGIGECADALYEATKIVQNWKAKCKN
jgi:hypothetical protein